MRSAERRVDARTRLAALPPRCDPRRDPPAATVGDGALARELQFEAATRVAQGARLPAALAALFAQRFGSALNLNLHFHALLLDGAFVSPSGRLAPSFQPSAPLTDAEVAELVEQLARRVTRYLERQGRLPRAHAPADADEPAEHDAPLFDQLCAASIQGGVALAPESSRPIARLGQRRSPRPPPPPGSLCADHNGFSLHARVLVPAGELERLEHLCGVPFATTQRRRCDSSLRDEPGLTHHPPTHRDAAPRAHTRRSRRLRPQTLLA